MSYLVLSRRIARYLVTRTNTHVPEDVLAYAVEVLLLNTINVIVALLLGFCVRALPETMVVIAVVALVRAFAGGAHSTSRVRCTIVTGLVFPLLAVSAKTIVGFNSFLALGLLALAFSLGITATVAFAPVDSPAAPIISQRRRNRLKSGSIVMVVLLSVVGLTLAGDTFRASISLGILWSAFILTPTGHKLFQFIDSLRIARRGGVST